MPSTWTSEREVRMLVLIICKNDFKPQATWASVAADLGEGVTAEAVRQHYHKLKKNAGVVKTGAGNDNAELAALSSPQTPKTPKTPKTTKPRKPAAGSGKAKKLSAAGEVFGEEADASETGSEFKPAADAAAAKTPRKRKTPVKRSKRAETSPLSSPGAVLPNEFEGAFGGETAVENAGNEEDDVPDTSSPKKGGKRKSAGTTTAAGARGSKKRKNAAAAAAAGGNGGDDDEDSQSQVQQVIEKVAQDAAADVTVKTEIQADEVAAGEFEGTLNTAASDSAAV